MSDLEDFELSRGPQSNPGLEVQNDDVDMPKTSKRVKPNRRQTVDPFEVLHEHLHELILQHFDAPDVLILSEVNRTWFDLIGESRHCMKKINLGLENWWQTESSRDISRIMKIANNSSRRYQNVYINCNDDALVSRQAVRLLKTLAPSLVDLRFLNADKVVVNQQYKFPKLQRLQFINNVGDVDDLLLQGSTKLTELNLKHHYWADVDSVLKCLKDNPSLTILKLWDTGVPQLFKKYEPNMLKFKLKRFASGCDGQLTKEAETNFIHFLDSQSDTIEAVRFRSGLVGVNGEIINQLFRMKALKIIHLDGIGDIDGIKLAVNPNLIELRLPWSIVCLQQLMLFLRATPNVVVLCIRKINKEILEYVAKHLKNLRLLHYTKVDGCMGCFKKFLSTQEGINNNIMLVCKEWY